MKLTAKGRLVSILAMFVTGLLSAGIPIVDVSAQDRQPNTALVVSSPEHSVLRQTTGTWYVRASLWFGRSAAGAALQDPSLRRAEQRISRRRIHLYPQAVRSTK